MVEKFDLFVCNIYVTSNWIVKLLILQLPKKQIPN